MKGNRVMEEAAAHRAGERKGTAARSVVAGQFSGLLQEASMTGGEQLTVERLRKVSEMRRRGDPVLLRAAIMDAAVALGLWAVRLDLRQPPERP